MQCFHVCNECLVVLQFSKRVWPVRGRSLEWHEKAKALQPRIVAMERWALVYLVLLNRQVPFDFQKEELDLDI